MNSKRVKLIKKGVYRKDDPRVREYKQLPNGQVISDVQRTVYQEQKKECKGKSRKDIREHLRMMHKYDYAKE